MNRTTIIFGNISVKDSSWNFGLFHESKNVYYDITIEGKVTSECVGFGVLTGRITGKGLI